MRELENAVFALGHTPKALMLQAGERMSQAVLRYYPSKKHATAYLGKGHNAGDALVVAKQLQKAGWTIHLRCPYPEEDLSPLTLKMFQSLGTIPLDSPTAPEADSLLIDGLLGISPLITRRRHERIVHSLK